MKIFDGIHDLVLLYVGSIIGAIVAVLYILFDIFYLKKKLENNSRPRLIRFITIIIITTIVGVTHYILEKVVDII